MLDQSHYIIPTLFIPCPTCLLDSFTSIPYGSFLNDRPTSMLFHLLSVRMHVCSMLSRFGRFETPQTAAHQAPLCMGFPRQEYQSRLPFLSPGDLPSPGIEPDTLSSAALAADCLPLYYLGRQTFLKYKIDHILLCSAFSKVFP